MLIRQKWQSINTHNSKQHKQLALFTSRFTRERYTTKYYIILQQLKNCDLRAISIEINRPNRKNKLRRKPQTTGDMEKKLPIIMEGIQCGEHLWWGIIMSSNVTKTISQSEKPIHNHTYLQILSIINLHLIISLLVSMTDFVM